MNNTDCIGCHQLGQEATRTIPAQFGKFNSGAGHGSAASPPASLAR